MGLRLLTANRHPLVTFVDRQPRLGDTESAPLGFVPNISVSLGVVEALPAFPKPRVLIRGVAQHLVNDNLEA